MLRLDSIEVDYVVVGCSVAGLRAAIELGQAGSALMLSKSDPTDTATAMAQVGIAAALSDEDRICLHERDTLEAGDGLCNPAAVKVLVEEGPPVIDALITWGTQFERTGTKLAFTREGARSRSRVLHARGAATGLEIGRALAARARALPQIQIRSRAFATELLVEDGRVTGLRFVDEADGRVRMVTAGGVLLACGGLGHLFRDTTNSHMATGDGMAMAFDAGAELRDLEFVQFHPTALQLKGAPRLLLSQSLLCEGALLRNADLERFMRRYHEGLEQAPREVIARAIVSEMHRTQTNFVYVDLTGRQAETLCRRYSRIFETCQSYGVDPTADLVPVSPAAHYAIGGVKADLDGRTSIPGLYAAGETAATGVHGANRLASNALLEGVVFGARTGRAMVQDCAGKRKRIMNAVHAAETDATPVDAAAAANDANKTIAERLDRIRTNLWDHVGILRNGRTLARALEDLSSLAIGRPMTASRTAWELYNAWTLAQLITRSAIAREESRGTHYRSDFPYRHDEKFQKHSLAIRGKSIAFEDISPAAASCAAGT